MTFPAASPILCTSPLDKRQFSKPNKLLLESSALRDLHLDRRRTTRWHCFSSYLESRLNNYICDRVTFRICRYRDFFLSCQVLATVESNWSILSSVFFHFLRSESRLLSIFFFSFFCNFWWQNQGAAFLANLVAGWKQRRVSGATWQRIKTLLRHLSIRRAWSRMQTVGKMHINLGVLRLERRDVFARRKPLAPFYRPWGLVDVAIYEHRRS